MGLLYKETWSWLNRMYYVMYDESFLLEILNMSIVQEVVIRDHFSYVLSLINTR